MEIPSKVYKLIEQMKDNVKKANGKRNENIDCQLLTELRRCHRELYYSIEQNRNTNQSEKDQLDRETIHSVCLDYTKTQLQTSIKQFLSFQTINFDNIKEHLQLSKKDPIKDQQEIINKLEEELEVRKQKKVKLEEINEEYSNLEKTYAEKEKQYFTVLPEQLRGIQSSLQPILSQFKIPQIALQQQQQYYRDLPKPLMKIYQKLESKFITIEILKHPPTDAYYKQSEYELKVYFDEGIQDKLVFDYFNLDYAQFYENIYPVKFGIRYFPTLDQIVFSVDRQNVLTSEQLFCGLFQGDPGVPLFLYAQSDEEININTRYMAFSWTRDLAGYNLSAQQFYESLQERVYNIQLLKLQLSRLQRGELPKQMPGLTFEQRFQLKYFGSAQLSEEVPFWYELCKGETINQESQRCLQKSNLVDDETLNNYLKQNYVFEHSPEHYHDCYKLVLSKDLNQEIEIGICIPLSYPKQQIRFILLNLCNFSLSKKKWFTILQNLGSCLKEGLQLSYLILRITQELGISTQPIQCQLKY